MALGHDAFDRVRFYHDKLKIIIVVQLKILLLRYRDFCLIKSNYTWNLQLNNELQYLKSFVFKHL